MNAVHSGFHYVLSQYVIDILWEFYCFSFGNKWEKQEKATDDRQRSGKYERNLRAKNEESENFLRQKYFSCKKRGTIYQRGTRPIYGYIMGCTF